MRRIDELFARYGESHQNRLNEAFHWVCVPLITWSLVAMLWTASPVMAWVFIAAALAFYLWLSLSIALGMLAVCALLVYTLTLLEAKNTLFIAIAVFVAAWIGQFIGHRIEGRKPSFFEDVKFLLVGPAWLLGIVYRRLGIAY
jgi:uncharacterized membrane protein YGL010W